MAKPLFNQRRKLSNAPAGGGANGLSFSGNDAYDGVLSSAAGLKPKLGAAAAAPGRKVAVEDYSEIFGARNGKRGASIPVLDLDELDATNGWGDLRSSGRKVDYSVIFGGGNEAPLAVPAFEELFKTNEAKARNPSGTGSPLKGSDRFMSSENIKRKGRESSDQMLDSGKQFNMSYHKIGQRRKDVLKGTTHITQLNAIPGFTYVIDESVRMRESQQEKAIPPAQTEVNCRQSTGESLQKAKQDKAVPPVKAEVNSRSPGKDKFDGKVGGRTKWQVPIINASEGVEKHKVEDNKDADYSKNKLSNANDFGLKSHVSVETSLSGYSANQKESMGQHKWSKLPSFGLKAEASEGSSGYAIPFSEEELDANSAAAASIEALKKALEQAQETIRIAKEKMEKKSRSRDCLKATSRSGTNCALEASSPRDSNVMETCKIPESEVQDPIKFEMEIKSGHGGSEFSEKEKPATRRHTDGEKDSESVEVAGDNGVATWFSQLLNNGKQKMAALASELVVKKNSGLQPVNEDIDYVEIKPAKMNSESVKKVSDIDRYTDAQLNVHGKSEDSKRNMGSYGASQCVNDDRPSETLIFSEKEEVTMNRQQNFDKEEGDKVSPEHYHKAFSDVQFELPELGTVLLESDLLKVEEKSFERETSRLDDFSVRDGDSGMVDEVVNRKEQEEFHPVVDYEDVGRGNEDDEPDQAAGYMSDGKRPEVDLGERSESYDKEESDGKRLAETDEGEMKSDGKRLAETDEGEIKSNGKRLAETDEGEMKHLLSEKESLQEEIDGKPAGPHKNEESDSRVDDNSSESQKIEVNEELQECGGESRDSSFDAVHDQSFDAANAYGGASLFDFQNTCIAVLGKMSEQTSRLGIRDLEEKGDLAWSREESSQQESRNKEGVADNVEITEQLTELDGEAKAELSVEGQSNLVGENILGTSSMYHINDEMNIMKSVTQDVSTASGSTVNTATFDFISMLHESQQSKNLGRSSFSSHGTEQGVIEDERASDTAECKNSSTSDFSGLDEQTQVNESDKKFACNSDDLDGSIQEVHGQYHILEESDRKFACNSEDLNGSIHEEQGQYHIEEGGRESKSFTHAESESESESQGSEENGDGDGIACDRKMEEDSSQIDDKEQEWVQNEKDSETSQFSGADDVETDSDGKTDQSSENCEENVSRAAMNKEKETGETLQKEGLQKDEVKKSEVKKRDVKRERERMAVDRAIREARERAFAEARERAERAAVEKVIAEANQRTMVDAREKHDNVTSGPKVQVVEASIAAKRRAERAAVERATAEARERALSKAMSQKAVGDVKTQTARDAGLKHSYSSSELENNKESALRRKAKLEKDQRINERAAKALHEKNFRDALAQREQAQKNRLAETLDAEIKRWASGKEGNLRALLSTLQYILGSDSGWKPISLTDIVTSVALKKAYRQATLHVHPDKLQQRGASIRQKYICEKVFDLLQAAWSKYNSEER